MFSGEVSTDILGGILTSETAKKTIKFKVTTIDARISVHTYSTLLLFYRSSMVSITLYMGFSTYFC